MMIPPRAATLACEPVRNSCTNPTDPPNVNWQQYNVVGRIEVDVFFVGLGDYSCF